MAFILSEDELLAPTTVDAKEVERATGVVEQFLAKIEHPDAEAKKFFKLRLNRPEVRIEEYDDVWLQKRSLVGRFRRFYR